MVIALSTFTSVIIAQFIIFGFHFVVDGAPYIASLSLRSAVRPVTIAIKQILEASLSSRRLLPLQVHISSNFVVLLLLGVNLLGLSKLIVILSRCKGLSGIFIHLLVVLALHLVNEASGTIDTAFLLILIEVKLLD